MPPKVKTTKEEIISAALNLVRTNGESALNARNIAAELNCSTQPIFSNFTSMDELRLSVVKKANELCQEYTKREVHSGEHPFFKATGMAYIRFAKEEKELFKFLYMRDRSNETIPEDSEHLEKMATIIQNNIGISETAAKLFHLEIWAYVHGIASMLATGFLDLEWDLISKMLTDAYLGLKKQYESE